MTRDPILTAWLAEPGSLDDLVCAVREDERRTLLGGPDVTVDDAYRLLVRIGLDITYTDDGLRTIAKRLVDMGRADATRTPCTPTTLEKH